MNYTVMGAGAWGTAMAIHIARSGESVTLLPRRMEHALDITGTRENTDYLPGFPLGNDIQIAGELRPAIMEADVLVLACPMRGLRELCERIRAERDAAWKLACLLTLCKGLEPEHHLLPSEVVEEVLPDVPHAVFSGPTFAHEVAVGMPTAITLAAPASCELRGRIQKELSSDKLRIYLSDDVRGVELGGCLKNIYAIGAGIADGLKLGDNAKAAYLTRVVREMMDLTKALGGAAVTCSGLSGFGDLVATCSGKGSRNRTFGQELASGRDPQSIIEGQRTVVEGYWAAKSFYELVEREQLSAPILRELHAVLYESKPPQNALHALMTRELKEEVS